ncbi:MAG: hypothetical protein ABF979_05090, partial [Gluconobacter sp.]|uniref:hypothetical protein n=1 Tax=Gluconobacter sp. TaxID=1876758 RepID=UPI0039E7B15A
QTLEEGPAASVNGLIRPPTHTVNQKIIEKSKNLVKPFSKSAILPTAPSLISCKSVKNRLLISAVWSRISPSYLPRRYSPEFNAYSGSSYGVRHATHIL